MNNNKEIKFIDKIELGTDDIVSIISEAIPELKMENEDTYNLLLDKVREGFFEQHQTPQAMKRLARELLSSLLQSEEENEN